MKTIEYFTYEKIKLIYDILTSIQFQNHIRII